MKKYRNPTSPWSKAVRKALIDKDMDLKDLAELTGYTRQYLSMVISGKRQFCYEAEEKISKALGVKYPYVD